MSEPYLQTVNVQAAQVGFEFGPAIGQVFPYKPRTLTTRKVWIIMFTLKDDENVPVSIKPVDAKGNAARVDGKPEWSSNDTAIATVTASDDGLSAVVGGGTKLGTARITVKVDADLGPGVREIIGVLDVEVVGGEAVSVTVTPGVPVPQ